MTRAATTTESGQRRSLREREAAAQAADDLAFVMSDPRGRRFMWRLLGATGMYAASFNHSGSITAFNEGQRNIGLKLVADITGTIPEQYLVMQGEAIEADRKERERALLDDALDNEEHDNG